MRILVTMHMPSAQGFSVHQLTLDYPADSLDEVCFSFNEAEFVKCRLWYRQMGDEGEMAWVDKGDIVINTNHVGKIQEYIYNAREHKNDEPHGHSGAGSKHVVVERTTVRQRRGNL